MEYDLHRFNTERIKGTHKQNSGSEVFERNLYIGKNRLARLKSEDSAIVTFKPELLREIEKFYGYLYVYFNAEI